METIADIENEIVEEFSLFDDWMDKYEHLISLGKSLPLVEEQYKTDEYTVKGCQSKVWLFAALQDGKVIYTADSDAIITKGIIALLVRVLSGRTPAEILQANLAFIDEIGLKEHLSPTRSNGLVSMVRQMKNYALVFQTQEEK